MPALGVRVLQACGFVRSGGRYVLPPGVDVQAVNEARELIECLLLSMDEKGCCDTTVSTATPEGGSGSEVGGGNGNTVPTSVATPTSATATAAPCTIGTPILAVASSTSVGVDGSSTASFGATQTPSQTKGAGNQGDDEVAARSAAASISDDAALAAALAAEEETPRDALYPSGANATRQAASATAPATGRSSPAEAEDGHAAGAADSEDRDRVLAERFAKEDEPKVVAFERFRGEEVVVDSKVVEEITQFCRERGEKYVDPQFPPMNRSLYLAAWEADQWECQLCLTKTNFPPQPPMAKNAEEVHQQEESFRKNTCIGCGAPPPYVTQVRWFTRPAQWLRPGDRCEGCEAVYGHLPNGSELVPQMCSHFVRDSITHATFGSSWKLIREAARPEDVCQGGLGNCWLAGALSVVAQMPHLIDRLFLTKECNPWGVYYVQLCHAGQWQGLVLDDLFPTSKLFEGYFNGNIIYYSRGGSLCYLQAARRQLWVPLVEKAAAKLYGSYGSLKGGTLGEALALFTGFPTQRIKLYISKADREDRAKRRSERQNRNMQRLLAGALDAGVANEDSDDGDENDDLTWIKLLSCKESGYLMGMGCTEDGCEKSRHHIVEEMGLQAPHAYGILDLREAAVNGEIVRLVKIRNPWGERAPRTWNGDWGKDSAKWTPELQRELGVVNSSGVPMDDPMSIFWMSFRDVRQYFAQAEVCRVHSDWHEVRLRAWLQSAVGPGEAFDLSVPRKTSVDIALWQEKNIAREGSLGARSTNVDVGFALLRNCGASTDGQTEYELVDYEERSCSDDVSKEMVLEGGCVYRLVPLCFSQILEPAPRCAVVAIHAVHQVELKKVQSSWRDVSCAAFEAARKRGKRCTDRMNVGTSYWLFNEPAGCIVAAENNTNKTSAVQVDTAESLGCISSRGGVGVVALIPPRTRQVSLVLAVNTSASSTRLSIQLRPVPVDLATPVKARDDLHFPFPLMSEALRAGRREHPVEDTVRAIATADAGNAVVTPVEPPGRGAAGPPGATATGADGVASTAIDEDGDLDLAAALRLSLEPQHGASSSAQVARGGEPREGAADTGGNGNATRAPVTSGHGLLPAEVGGASVCSLGGRQTGSTASQVPSADAHAPAADDERLQLQARAKQLFSAYRSQGLPPTEAAMRAGEEARREVWACVSAV
eukprot:TRINITY_DN43225_c0_g1_i1.p1 TRINITY_DN43225_c0_g1~~TRINITY_DN43225_c0_g1_i1.p1  ORF type:complete len:1201 (-),score=233.46 TRINITY_DN43225_c0_g1_i1:89-3592(-)